MVVEKIYIADKLTQDQIKQGVDSINTQIANKNAGKVLKSKTFTTNGTFTVPDGVTEVYITGGGAGGGGAAVSSTATSVANGTAGGVTSFGSLLSLSGGQGGTGGDQAASRPGLRGGPGGEHGGFAILTGGSTVVAGGGGNGGPYFGGQPSVNLFNTASPQVGAALDGGYCSGGAGTATTALYASGGGSGDFVYDKQVQVTPLAVIIVTIGQGGQGALVPGAAGRSGNGGNGILTVKWWE